MHAFLGSVVAQRLPNLFFSLEHTNTSICKAPEARTRSYHLPAQEASVPKKSYGLNIFWQVLFVLVKKSKQ